MKLQSLKLFVATLFIGICAAVPSFAQSTVGFEIPFDFQVGKAKFTAGKYEVRKMDTQKYVLVNPETRKSLIVIALAPVGDGKDVRTAKLVFNRYGETHFLREIYQTKGTVGAGLAESKAEKQIRRGRSAGEQLADAGRVSIDRSAQ